MSEPTTSIPVVGSPICRLLESLTDHCRQALEDILHAEIDEALGAGRHERTETRQGYRNGSYQRTVVTVGGSTTVDVPRAQVKGEDGKLTDH